MILTTATSLIENAIDLCRAAGLRGYAWDGSTYRGYDLPPAEGGDSCSMSHFRDLGSPGHYLSSDDTPEYFEVPVTLWGDYCGDGCGRSNHRSLLRDYPETFVNVSGGFYSYNLMIPVATLASMDDPEEMVNLFTGLRDEYPLYDEEDHSALESEIAEQAWDAYLKYDLPRDLRDALASLLADDADGPVNELADEIVDAIDDADLRERYFAAVWEGNEYPYLESADSVVFPGYAEIVAELAYHYASTSEMAK